MHPEVLGGGVAEFDAAIESRECPFLNELGEAALQEMRSAYEQIDAGNFEVLGEMANRLAAATQEQSSLWDESTDRSTITSISASEDSLVQHNATIVLTEKMMVSVADQERQHVEEAAQLKEAIAQPPVATVEIRKEAVLREQNYGQDQDQDITKREAPIEPGTDLNAASLVDAPPKAPQVEQMLDMLLTDVAATQVFEEHEKALQASVVAQAKEMKALQEESAVVTASLPKGEVVARLSRPGELLSQIGTAEPAPEEMIREETGELEPLETVAVPGAIEFEEQYKELAVLDDFAQSLELWLEQLDASGAEDTNEEVFLEAESGALERTADNGPVAVESVSLTIDLSPEVSEETVSAVPIVRTVAERLVNLEVEIEEIVVPIVQHIAETVQDLRLIQDQMQVAEPEVLVEVQERLEQLCVQLFEAISIKYDQEVVREFAGIITMPSFRPHATVGVEIAQADLMREGTREAKSLRLLTTLGQANTDRRLNQVLGIFVLCYVLAAVPGKKWLLSLAYTS